MIENVKHHNETITIYSSNGITYNGSKSLIKDLFDKELEAWQRSKNKK